MKNFNIPETIKVPFDGNNSIFWLSIADPKTGRPFTIIKYYYWNSSTGKRDGNNNLILTRNWGPLTYITWLPDFQTSRY